MVDIKHSEGEDFLRRHVLFDKLIWTIEEVCQFTTYKRGTIYNLVSEGSIPYRKCGRKLFFVPSEILKWIKGEQR
ncbi:MAG: helix-turn-helix domain-containing protein [Bdellovibrionales bacterium]|nr:helix-turn-helix domain-containing protein [Bdellovibrionales bacterium]